MEKLTSHPANAILELNGLQPGQKVERSVAGVHRARDQSGALRCRSLFRRYAAGGRVPGSQHGADQLRQRHSVADRRSSPHHHDGLERRRPRRPPHPLRASYGGQLLFANVTEATVKRVVGPGAVWPDLTRQQIADEVWLEVEAGSSGNPNQAQEIANAQKIYPLVMQIPGIDPEFLARDLLQPARRQARPDARRSRAAAVDRGDEHRLAWRRRSARHGADVGPGEGRDAGRARRCKGRPAIRTRRRTRGRAGRSRRRCRVQRPVRRRRRLACIG